MPANKYLKRDKPSEQYRIPSKIELLSKMAAEQPYRLGKEEPGLSEPLVDPYPIPQGGKLLKLAVSLPYATKQILQYLPKQGVLSAAKKRGVEDAIKVLEATPKRVLQTVSDLEVHNPELYNKAANILGHWSFERRLGTAPWISKGAGLDYTLPEAVSHELGHGATERLLQRRGKTLEHLFDPKEQVWEGVAEYLGESLAKKAKVPYAAKFPYGFGQQATYEALTEMPSKNPYMNVYRYLQKEGVFE